MRGDIGSALIASTPGGIEAQEKSGQKAFVNSSTLPKKMLSGCTRGKLEQIGIKFGEDADDLFVNVTLPDGWKIKALDGQYSSDLIDEKGRSRANIFYKAAFYDRRANIRLIPRFVIESCVGCNESGEAKDSHEATHYKTVVLDCATPIKEFGILEASSPYELWEQQEKAADDWLSKTHPDWRDPCAYWN